MSGHSALFRMAAFAMPAALLTACPQLLSDEFYLDMTAAGAAGSSDREPDASIDLDRDSGVSGGSGGRASMQPGPGRDAGPRPPPPNPIQVALHAALVH